MKGAIQVSVGFLIIMVVSALVLIFIMSWLGQLFPQLEQITTYATQQAEQEMMNKFAEGTDIILATVPYGEKFQPGSEVHFKLGVKKTTSVDEFEYFAFCVGTMETVTCTTPDELTPVPIGDSGVSFKFAPVAKIIERDDIKRLSAIMTIPKDTDPGIYGFKVYACAVTQPTSKCTGLTSSYGDFDFLIEVQ